MPCNVEQPLAEGVDYVLDLVSGRIKFLSTGALGPTIQQFFDDGGCAVRVDYDCPGPIPFSCTTKIDECLPCNDEPILNISAETPDTDRYLSRFSFLNAFPPIRQYPDFDEQGGGIFLQVGCMRWCWSTVSQEDADLCAERQAVECAFNPLAPGMPIPTPFSPNRIQLFYNIAVTGFYTCPDGNVFSYTLPANQIAALTQGRANAIAAAIARQRARAHRLCITDMDDPICVNTWASKTITAFGANVARFPFVDRWDLVSGTVPTGMTLTTGFSSNGITLSGIPTSLGTFTFRVRVTLSTPNSIGFGDFMEKTFNVKIVGIDQSSPLPNACIGLEYDEQLTASGSTNPTGEIWSITSGSLPPGINLSPQGKFEGTPTGPLAGYSFTVQAQFPVGNITAVCSKEMSISIGVPVDLGTVTPDITSAVASFFDSGNPQPAGRYRILYETGAMQYAACSPDPCWSVNAGTRGFHYRYFAPGLTDALFPASINAFLTQAGAESDNAGKFVDFDTTISAAISMYLDDSPYGDNQPGTPNPTFRLFRLC